MSGRRKEEASDRIIPPLKRIFNIKLQVSSSV
jgi:hypothetical protein